MIQSYPLLSSFKLTQMETKGLQDVISVIVLHTPEKRLATLHESDGLERKSMQHLLLCRRPRPIFGRL